MKRRVLSILLCLCLVCGLLPTGALAFRNCTDSEEAPDLWMSW